MFHALQTLASTAVMERATLLVNHVLASEPIAQQRLQTHAGRCISLQFDGWPTLLPPLPPTTFRVTAAGLVEWCGAEVPEPAEKADLRVAIDASNPALLMLRSLAGERPRIEVAGDAVFATDVNWLFDNLRWDVQDDLARIVGEGPAREIARLGRAIATALREAARSVGGLVQRSRDAAGGTSGRGEDGAGPPPR
jgi:ubiquinone biosynthesis protein UbiJ